MGSAWATGGSTETATGERLPNESAGKSEDWGWADDLGAKGVDELCQWTLEWKVGQGDCRCESLLSFTAWSI